MEASSPVESFIASAQTGSFSAAARPLGADAGKPAGTFKLSAAIAFGREYLVPMLGEFLRRYPVIVPDWRFDNRPVACAHGRCATR